MNNPFKGPIYNGHQTYTQSAEERILMVKKFDADQCRDALELPHLQSTVARAVNARLRKLERGAA